MKETIQFISTGKTVDPATIFNLFKQDLIKELIARKITFDKKITKSAMVELIFADAISREEVAPQTVEVELDKTNQPTEQELKRRAKDILQKAETINSDISKLSTPEEVKVYVEGVTKNNPALYNYVMSSLFPKTNGEPTFDEKEMVLVADDLPVSSIITNMPIRVLEQVINNIIVEFPLMEFFPIKNLRNGIEDIFYKDFRKGDNTSGYSDVVIGDFNNGTEPIFKEVARVDTNFHKSYDILDSMLDDITTKGAGFFLSLIADYTYAISYPFAQMAYERALTLLDDNATFDEVITFTGTSAKDKTKEVFAKTISLNTPSRTHLKLKPVGSAKSLLKNVRTSDLVMVANSKYMTDYNFDFSANVFQADKVKIPFKKIITFDFDLFKEFLPTGNKGVNIAKKEILLLEKDIFEIIRHFQAEKTMLTPKMKTVLHRYERFGSYRRKDKILLGFINKV